MSHPLMFAENLPKKKQYRILLRIHPRKYQQININNFKNTEQREDDNNQATKGITCNH